MNTFATAEAALEPVCDELTWLPPGSTVRAVGGRLEVSLGDALTGATLPWLVEKLRNIAPGIPYRMTDVRTGEVLAAEAAAAQLQSAFTPVSWQLSS